MHLESVNANQFNPQMYMKIHTQIYMEEAGGPRTMEDLAYSGMGGERKPEGGGRACSRVDGAGLDGEGPTVARSRRRRGGIKWWWRWPAGTPDPPPW